MEKFEELSFEELKEMNGGGLVFWLVCAVVTHVITEIVFNPKEHLEAFKEGYNSTAERPL
ncbi:bacteriocin class II family protein [Cecembia rubra]|uniref:Lactobin A/cerein 7B family class IIb bacteriocin n=1 Tax=Cecembia rubra TaxID=1485585 RepID=A0A2P8E697_9BACT|nr:bacteriocin class II family protein [Cecembia rubra]PSL04968.1 hypothetical protein CLV48_104142 [Cecembia rubra]